MQHLLDFSTYKLSIAGLISVDLCPVLMAQPLQLMVRDWSSGHYAWSVLIWHERLIKPQADHEQALQTLTRRVSRVMSAVGLSSSGGGSSVAGSSGGDSESGGGDAGGVSKGWRSLLSFKK